MLKHVDVNAEPRRGDKKRAEAVTVRSEPQRDEHIDRIPLVGAVGCNEKSGEEPCDDKKQCVKAKQTNVKQNGTNDALVESRTAKTERACADLLHGNENEYLMPQQVNFVVASVAQEHLRQSSAEERYPVRSRAVFGQSHGEPVRGTDRASTLSEHNTAADIKGTTVTTTLPSTYVDNVAPHVIPAGDNCGGVPDKAERPRSRRSLRPRYGSASRCMQRLVGSEFDAPARTPLPEKSYLEQDFEAKFISFWPTNVPVRREKPRAAECKESDAVRTSSVNDNSATCFSNSSLNRKSVRFDAFQRGASAGGAGQCEVANKDVDDLHSYCDPGRELSSDDLADPSEPLACSARHRSGHGVRRQSTSGRRTSDESSGIHKAQDEAIAAHFHENTSRPGSRARDIKSIPDEGRVGNTLQRDTVVSHVKSAQRRSTLDVTHGDATTKHDAERFQRVPSPFRSRSRDLVPGQKSRYVSEANPRSPSVSPDVVSERRERDTLSRRRSNIVTPAKSQSAPNRHQLGRSGRCFNATSLATTPTRRASCTCSDIGPTQRDVTTDFWAGASGSRSLPKDVAQTTSMSASSRRTQNADSTSRKDAAHIHYTPSPHSHHSDSLPVGRRACAKTGNVDPVVNDGRDQSDSDSNSSCSTDGEMMEQQRSPVRGLTGGVHPLSSVPTESMPERPTASPDVKLGATASMYEVHQSIIIQQQLLLLSSQ